MNEWPRFDSSFLLGVEPIDSQHRRLFEIAEKVYRHLGADTREALEAAHAGAAELIDYTATHFADEEAQMEAAGYPDVEAHRAEHAQLLSRARDMDMRAQFDDRNLPAELCHFLLSWMVGHIRSVDRKFGDFLAARGAKP